MEAIPFSAGNLLSVNGLKEFRREGRSKANLRDTIECFKEIIRGYAITLSGNVTCQ